MIRSAMAVLALFVLSGLAFPTAPAEAQQEARTHEVERGETLWSIAEEYYRNGRLWTRIWDANRDRLGDPDAIEVGMSLTIPPAGGAEGAEVGGVTVVAPEEETRGEPVAEGERQERPPQQVPERRWRRTVFWPDTVNPTFVADFGPALSAVSPDVAYSAPWLVGIAQEPERSGQVVGYSGGERDILLRKSAKPHDHLLVTFDGPVPSVGSLLQVFRAEREVPDVGRVVIPTGVLRVIDIQPAGAVTVVEKVYARMAVGDLVGPLPAYPIEPGERAVEVPAGSTAGIIGFANPRPVYSIGDVVFLDKGSEDGVSIGDEYVVVISSEGWTGEVEGELQVIQLRSDHASARITGERAPIFEEGVQVRLVRKMR